MADDAYQPTGSNEEQEDAGPLDMQDAVGERTYDDMLDEGYSPARASAGRHQARHTAAEQHAGETLDERLGQEVPDVTPPAGDEIGDLPGGEGEPVDPAGAARAGRLGGPGTRAPTPTHRRRRVAQDVGIDGERWRRRRRRCTWSRTRTELPE
ncbi:hypothetical protein LT493_08610 [Streptomyces tricolor]|nr:hypothetical protein [Streptomyces tricolor]